MTTIGDILDEFFSPFSKPKVWVMPQNDNYTKVVRTWQPVITACSSIKSNLQLNCALWKKTHMTSPKWTPGPTDPPVTDPRAFGVWVPSPPGTDPTTCKNAFVIYVTSKVAGMGNPLLPEVQTKSLYTCSIGSFGVYATVDKINCVKKTATIQFWMYNAMDKKSFGPYAKHKAFSLSGMKRQYMWWNWSESVDWTSGSVKVVPTAGSGGSW